MKQYIIYVLMGVVALFIVFLLLRVILQIIFIKTCPKCGKTVSLAKSKICSRCGYDFNERRDPKFHGTVAVLVLCILGLGFFDVYTFRTRTRSYDASNPYISVKSITKDAEQAEETEEVISTEAVTETPIEGE